MSGLASIISRTQDVCLILEASSLYSGRLGNENLRVEGRMNFSDMQWLNEPKEWNGGTTLSAKAEAATDFWRENYENGVRHNGHFLFDFVSGDFKASVKLSGNYNSQYDQAGIMVLNTERTWLKCGVELLDGRMCASAVMTRGCSDWSIIPLDNPAAMWIQCERTGTSFTVRYSLNGEHYEMMRQAFLTDELAQQVGLMFAAPRGNGFDVLFEDFLLSKV